MQWKAYHLFKCLHLEIFSHVYYLACFRHTLHSMSSFLSVLCYLCSYKMFFHAFSLVSCYSVRFHCINKLGYILLFVDTSELTEDSKVMLVYSLTTVVWADPIKPVIYTFLQCVGFPIALSRK